MSVGKGRGEDVAKTYFQMVVFRFEPLVGEGKDGDVAKLIFNLSEDCYLRQNELKYLNAGVEFCCCKGAKLIGKALSLSL